MLSHIWKPYSNKWNLSFGRAMTKNPAKQIKGDNIIVLLRSQETDCGKVYLCKRKN